MLGHVVSSNAIPERSLEIFVRLFEVQIARQNIHVGHVIFHGVNDYEHADRHIHDDKSASGSTWGSKGSSRNIRYEEAIGHTLLEVPDHPCFSAGDRDRERRRLPSTT